MSIRPLLNQLKELDIRIEINDGKLRLNAPEGKLTTALIEKLKNRKQEIIDFLQKNIRSQIDYTSIEPVEKKEYYPLTSSQKRLYLLQQMGEDYTAYNMSQGFPLPKDVDKGKLVTVFNRLIARHETLRTSFEVVDGEPVQRVHKNIELNLQLYKTDEAGWDNVRQDFTRPFDLSVPPLVRVGLVEIESPSPYYYLLVEMHHIISDEVSQTLLLKEFTALAGDREPLPLKLQYTDFAEWENSSVRQASVRKQEAYWLKQFEGELPVLNLPLDFPRPAVQSNMGCSVDFHLPLKDSAALRTVARQEGATMFMVLLTVYNIFLAKLCGREDIIVGTPVAGRKHSDLEKIIGVLINSLALRNFPADEKAVGDFLTEVKNNTMEAFENQEYPFEELVEKVMTVRSPGRNPIFDVMLNLLNQEDFHGTIPGGDDGDSYTHVKRRVRFDMNLGAVDFGERILCTFFYCTALFRPEAIDRFIGYFKKIVSQLPGNLDRRIADIEIISDAEKHKLLYDFNAYESDYPRTKTVVQLFEGQVRRTPDNVAVVFEDNRLTYRQLNEQANRLGRLLRDQGVHPDTLVGLMVQRSVEMVVGIWGILKSGGAYLPVNPEAPTDRITYMLDNASVPVLLTREMFSEAFSGRYRVINLDSPALYTGSGENPVYKRAAVDLAYVIYTSGSTGKPKGVMIQNRSVINIVKWFAAQYDLKPGFQLLQMFEYTFDASINQIFGSLLHGVTLHVIRKEYFYDIAFLRDYIIVHFINLINFVQSVIKEVLCGREKIESLEHVISGAEKLKSTVKNEILDNGYTLYNQYGPTEATVDALAEKCSYESNGTVGVPVYNAQCYIVNKSGRLNPVGVAGELWVGGDGLARGYINNVELTVEKFVPNPFIPGTRVYKTGDLTRWLPEGNVEFLGRIDNQIKIRGFRIEPVEIAGQLVKIDGITEAVVIDREDGSGDTYLCAYLVGKEDVDIGEIKGILAKSLPDYMIPSVFVWIDQIPLSGHGKLIRSALPVPDITSGASGAYSAPGNPLEEKLVDIWSEVLGIEKAKIGIDHDFFELGGNSVKLIILMGKMNKEFKFNVPFFAHIYNNPRIRDLANFMIKSDLSEQLVILLNRERSKKLFTIPDQYGYGLGYTQLASAIEDYAFYVLNFIDDDNRLSRYVDIIKSIQPNGPYKFFGHSSAGPLTYEIALALEKQGCEVSDIIFGDCFFYGNARPMSDEEYATHIRPAIKTYLETLNAEFLMDKLIKKAIKYRKYRLGVHMLEKINANIHLILSEESQPGGIFFEADPHCWNKLTTKPSRVYNGWGDHQHMLMGEALKKNVEIIKGILY
jgi:amino acid adenylation domain-containing protein